MWIVKVALDRPYTFIILALLILLLSPVIILRTPVDIFPNINIPVIAISWTYSGLNPEEFEGRVTLPYEKALTTLVDNIQHIESTTYNSLNVVKVYLQPGASLDTANAQVTAASQFILRQLPPGEQPPEIINFSASSVPVLQLGISGKGLNEQQLNDYSTNFIRPQLITVPGSVLPSPYGGKQRQIMVNMDQRLMQSKGLAPSDILAALTAQSLVLPSGTAKIGQSEYDILNNVAPRTIEELNNIPIKQVDGAMIYMRDVATVSDGFQVQTNIVRQDGHRGVLISILKAGNASTLNVVKGVRAMLSFVASIVPPQLRMLPLSDQSIFVRSAVTGVIRETAAEERRFDTRARSGQQRFECKAVCTLRAGGKCPAIAAVAGLREDLCPFRWRHHRQKYRYWRSDSGRRKYHSQELFHLSSVARLRVFVPVPEIYQNVLYSVRQVGLSSDAYPKERFTGTIARSSDAIDPLSRTLRVEVDIDNPKTLLLPGAYVFVHLPLPAASQAPTIPSNAFLFRREGLRVGVVRNGHVQLVPISIGHDYGDTVEVTAGLSPEDQVVINPSDSLVSGTRVEINTNTQTGAAE